MEILNTGTYTRSEDEVLNFYECLQMLHLLVINEFIYHVPEHPETILIYREGAGENPEGFYAENIYSVARELKNDVEGQKYLRSVLSDNGIALEFVISSVSGCPYDI